MLLQLLKEIIHGQSHATLSNEERDALEMALNYNVDAAKLEEKQAQQATQVQQDMDEAAKSIKQQKLLSDEIASKLENKLNELREETKKIYRYLWRDRDKKSYGSFYVRGKACFNRTAASD